MVIIQVTFQEGIAVPGRTGTTLMVNAKTWSDPEGTVPKTSEAVAAAEINTILHALLHPDGAPGGDRRLQAQVRRQMAAAMQNGLEMLLPQQPPPPQQPPEGFNLTITAPGEESPSNPS